MVLEATADFLFFLTILTFYGFFGFMFIPHDHSLVSYLSFRFAHIWGDLQIWRGSSKTWKKHHICLKLTAEFIWFAKEFILVI